MLVNLNESSLPQEDSAADWLRAGLWMGMAWDQILPCLFNGWVSKCGGMKIQLPYLHHGGGA